MRLDSTSTGNVAAAGHDLTQSYKELNKHQQVYTAIHVREILFTFFLCGETNHNTNLNHNQFKLNPKNDLRNDVLLHWDQFLALTETTGQEHAQTHTW